MKKSVSLLVIPLLCLSLLFCGCRRAEDEGTSGDSGTAAETGSEYGFPASDFERAALSKFEVETSSPERIRTFGDAAAFADALRSCWAATSAGNADGIYFRIDTAKDADAEDICTQLRAVLEYDGSSVEKLRYVPWIMCCVRDPRELSAVVNFLSSDGGVTSVTISPNWIAQND